MECTCIFVWASWSYRAFRPKWPCRFTRSSGGSNRCYWAFWLSRTCRRDRSYWSCRISRCHRTYWAYGLDRSRDCWCDRAYRRWCCRCDRPTRPNRRYRPCRSWCNWCNWPSRARWCLRGYGCNRTCRHNRSRRRYWASRCNRGNRTCWERRCNWCYRSSWWRWPNRTYRCRRDWPCWTHWCYWSFWSFYLRVSCSSLEGDGIRSLWCNWRPG